jgi:hypothetical protein
MSIVSVRCFYIFLMYLSARCKCSYKVDYRVFIIKAQISQQNTLYFRGTPPIVFRSQFLLTGIVLIQRIKEFVF